MILYSVITQESVCGNIYEFCLALKMGCMTYE